jgi:hypothetical protein
MVLVSKRINNQWNINKLCRVAPDHGIRYDIYVELLRSDLHHIHCNFNKLNPEKSTNFNKKLKKC